MSCPQGYDKATIFIKPIAHDATVEELQLYYEQFGDILSVNIPADRLTQQFKGYAFIEFLHPDDAATARDRTNGSILLGHNVTVEIAEGPRKTPAEMQHRKDVRRRFQSSRDYRGRSDRSYHQHRSSFGNAGRHPRDQYRSSEQAHRRPQFERSRSRRREFVPTRRRHIEPIIRVSPSTSPSVDGSQSHKRSVSRSMSRSRSRSRFGRKFERDLRSIERSRSNSPSRLESR
ncbi:hypothetical protein BOX15_Mlig005216g1 [Macrostomum lignano]|uniref:RRM domain-containing protein n=1 Tax=Macrostomum lignano TaxID=282301 RepID=A0A267EUN6_9PLAT|nr:hypothetical protein BOX15_Mlig005216g1 [Macrostomum lignano]